MMLSFVFFVLYIFKAKSTCWEELFLVKYSFKFMGYSNKNGAVKAS
jgi:hypothetical protein